VLLDWRCVWQPYLLLDRVQLGWHICPISTNHPTNVGL
jgi:hypothetical protein